MEHAFAKAFLTLVGLKDFPSNGVPGVPDMSYFHFCCFAFNKILKLKEPMQPSAPTLHLAGCHF